jgi:hypothetical protein
LLIFNFLDAEQVDMSISLIADGVSMVIVAHDNEIVVVDDNDGIEEIGGVEVVIEYSGSDVEEFLLIYIDCERSTSKGNISNETWSRNRFHAWCKFAKVDPILEIEEYS